MILFQNPSVNVAVEDTSEPRIRILRLDFRSMPSTEIIDATMDKVNEAFQAQNKRLFTYVRVGSTNDVPGITQIMCMVGRLLSMGDTFDSKLKGTVVEMNGDVEFAQSMCDKWYQPTSTKSSKRLFKFVTTGKEGDEIVKSVLEHEAAKRARRDRMK